MPDTQHVGAEDASMPTPTTAEAEERLRRLLAENDLPMPDEVVHRPAEVVFLYHVQKLAFVFEIGEPPQK
jgi:hypothetical protein